MYILDFEYTILKFSTRLLKKVVNSAEQILSKTNSAKEILGLREQISKKMPIQLVKKS